APDHGPCAGFNEREALFWTLPALIAADPLLAREALLRAFEQYSHHPGAPIRYLDGAALSPGAALDQLAMYPIAVDRYVRETRDEGLLDEPIVHDVLAEIDEALFDRLHEEVFLCRSEFLPSGDRADFPYVTIGNVMVWVYANVLGATRPARRGEPP